MTKWARMRRRKEKRRSEDKEGKLTNPEKITENIQHSQETEKADSTKTFTPRTIIAQIPRYSYLVAIFVLLAVVLFSLIYLNLSFNHVIDFTAILYL